MPFIYCPLITHPPIFFLCALRFFKQNEVNEHLLSETLRLDKELKEVQAAYMLQYQLQRAKGKGIKTLGVAMCPTCGNCEST